MSMCSDCSGVPDLIRYLAPSSAGWVGRGELARPNNRKFTVEVVLGSFLT